MAEYGSLPASRTRSEGSSEAEQGNEIEPQSPQSSLELLLASTPGDTEFIVGPEEKRYHLPASIFHGHTTILDDRPPFSPTPVRLPSISVETFTILLHYLLGIETPITMSDFTNPSRLVSAYRASADLGAPGLKPYILDAISEVISSDTLPELTDPFILVAEIFDASDVSEWKILRMLMEQCLRVWFIDLEFLVKRAGENKGFFLAVAVDVYQRLLGGNVCDECSGEMSLAMEENGNEVGKKMCKICNVKEVQTVARFGIEGLVDDETGGYEEEEEGRDGEQEGFDGFDGVFDEVMEDMKRDVTAASSNSIRR